MRRVKLLQFLAAVLTALALVPAGTHLFELPNKIGLSESNYFIAQNIYRGWALFGVVLIGAVLANVALAVLIRSQRSPFILTLVSLLCLLATLAIFFAFVYPANQATSNWTAIPANWQELRWQWEIAHAVNAVITFIALCSLTISLLLTRE
jgi:NO-binding membrane sensor protein with MHYT domain